MSTIGIEGTRQAPAAPLGILGLPDQQAFTLRRWAPSVDLAWCIERFCLSSWDLPSERASVIQILPHPCVNLTLEQRRLRVTGVAHGVFSRRLTGCDRVFGVKFTPGSFRLLIDGPVATLSGTGQPADGILPGSHLLEQDLDHAEDDEERAALVEAYVRGRSIRDGPAARLVREAVAALAEDPAVRRVSDVAEQVGVSHRTLQRLFADRVGVSPGWVLRRGRLHAAAERVIDLAASGRFGGWADVAADLGYADQAHFTRDFRSVLGVPPSSWAASLITQEHA